MNIPENLKYSQDHEWLKVDGEFALVGITAHAANELGDIVFLDIPSVGETLDKDEVFGSIEAVKTVYGEGWIIKIKMTDAAQVAELMDAAAYTAMLG